MIGSVMSRGINDSAGLVATLAGGPVLIALHALVASLAYHTDWFGNVVKGKPVLLIDEGEVRTEVMRSSSLSENDLAEALRLQGKKLDPSLIERAYLGGTVTSASSRARQRRVSWRWRSPKASKRCGLNSHEQGGRMTGYIANRS